MFKSWLEYSSSSSSSSSKQKRRRSTSCSKESECFVQSLSILLSISTHDCEYYVTGYALFCFHSLRNVCSWSTNYNKQEKPRFTSSCCHWPGWFIFICIPLSINIELRVVLTTLTL
jgi:hypothetical protein